MTFKEKTIEKFEKHLAIASRFNPKEPVYGEENRRDLQTLKSFLSSALDEQQAEILACLPKKAVFDAMDTTKLKDRAEVRGFNSYCSQFLKNLSDKE